MSSRYQILSKFVRQRPQNRLKHKINAMAEGARRFGFPEMMFVIREAVRPSRRPSSYLSSHDVSKYIRNRYGLDKKAESNIPAPARYENAEYINKRSLSLNVPKETLKEDNRAKSLPRQLETQKTEISNKKSISEIAVNAEPQQQTSALVKQKTEKQQKQKENELKESNLKRNAKRVIKTAMSGTLMSEKSNYEILKPTLRPEKLVRDSNKNKEKKKTFDDFQDRFYQREESVKEANLRKLRERKIMVLTKRDLIYSKLQAKHLAMKQAVAMRSRKTQKESFSRKELLEPKIWTQIKKAYKEEQENKKKSPAVADQCEALILKTKDARNRLIEDLRMAEQRRQIELLRSMARETLDRHLEETRKQKTFTNFMGA